jgi:hypothetical protein
MIEQYETVELKATKYGKLWHVAILNRGDLPNKGKVLRFEGSYFELLDFLTKEELIA